MKEDDNKEEEIKEEKPEESEDEEDEDEEKDKTSKEKAQDKKKNRAETQELIESNLVQELFPLDDDLSNSETTLSQIMYGLVALLSPEGSNRPGFDMLHSKELWLSILKTLSLFKISENFAAKIAPLLLKAFSQLDYDIQDYVWAFLNTVFKILSIDSLEIIPELVNLYSAEKKTSNLKEGKIVSPIKLLLISSLEKVKKLQISKDSRYKGQYDEKLTKQIIQITIAAMKTSFRPGGKILKNSFDEETTVEYQAFESLFELIDIEKINDASPISFTNLLVNYSQNKSLIDSFAETLVNFHLMYRIESESSNPPCKSLSNISKKVKIILESYIQNTDALKVAVKCLLDNFETHMDTISDITCRRKSKGYIILNLTKQICTAFEELLIVWLKDPEIIKYFTDTLNSFEYLLKIIHLSGSSQRVVPPFFDHNEIAQYFSRRFGTLSPEDLSFSELFSTAKSQEAEPNEEEFANKVKLHRMRGQKWPKYTLDLMVKMNNSKILSFYIDDDEYCLFMEFEKFFELRSISVGILNMHDYGIDNQMIFPEIHVDAGPSISHITYIGKLKDEGRLGSAPNTNLLSLFIDGSKTTQSQKLEDILTSIPQIRVKYLKLRFRKPVVKFFEGFGFHESRSFKNLVLNLSFISVSGVDITKYSNLRDHILETTQLTAMKIIEHLSNQAPEAWKALAEKNFLVEKSQASLEAISSLIDINPSLSTKILLSIAKNSEEVGNWLFEKLLESARSIKYSSFIGELIVTDHSRVINRLEKLNKFLLQEAKVLAKTKTPEKYINEFESLSEFIEILTTSLYILPKDLPLGSTVLDVSVEDIENLIAIYHNFLKISSGTIRITKLILAYILPPQSIQIKDPNILKNALNSSFKIYQDSSNVSLLNFIGPLSISSVYATKWLGNELETIFQQIIKNIENTPNNQLKSLLPYFSFLNTLARSPTLKKKIADLDYHITFYNALKDQTPNATSILRTTDSEILNSVLNFIRKIILGDPIKEEAFIKIIKEDLLSLLNQSDNSFLELFLLPMIKSELEVPVCLFPYSEASKQYIYDLQSSLGEAKETRFSTKLFKPEQTNVFHNSFKRITKSAGTFSKYRNMLWEKAFSSTQDGDPGIIQAIIDKVCGKGPFLMILEGYVNQSFNFGGFPQPGGQSKKAVTGIFCGANFPLITNTGSCMANIDKAPDGFMFYYDEKKKLHFPLADSRHKSLGNINLYQHGGGISFYYHTTSPIFLSLAPGQFSYCSFDLLNIKPFEDVDDKYSILTLNQFTNVEIWVLKEDIHKQNNLKTSNIVKESNILRKDWFNFAEPLNYFRPMPVYNIPASIEISQLTESFFKENLDLFLKASNEKLKSQTKLLEIHEFAQLDTSSNYGIIDLQFNYDQYQTQKISQGFSELPKVKYVPNMTVFDAFKKQNGIECILKVATSNVEKWKKRDLATKWKQWIVDLKSLSDFPNFFEAFIKNPDSIELLFQILANKPDEDAQKSEEEAKKWKEKQESSNKYIYQALADSFSMVPSVQACELAIESNKFKNILDILEVITKEKPRIWVENWEEFEKKENTIKVIKKEENPEEGNVKKGKKKGVGYGSDYGGVNQGFGFGNKPSVNDTWNVNSFVEKKKMKNDQIMSLINVIASIFETKGWEPNVNVVKQLCESALLPLLEAAFRNGSLVDMGKESTLYLSYLRLVKAMSNHKILIPCLLELDRHYQPKQRDSIWSLLSHLKDISQIFINCLSNTEIKRTEEKKVEEETSGFGQPQPFIGDQPQNDVSNAWKIINKPMKYSSKQAYGFTSKEFIAQPVLTSNNPDLVPNMGG